MNISIVREVIVPSLNETLAIINNSDVEKTVQAFPDVDLLQTVRTEKDVVRANAIYGIFEEMLAAVNNQPLGETTATRSELWNTGKVALIVGESMGAYLNRERAQLNAVVGNRLLTSSAGEVPVVVAASSGGRKDLMPKLNEAVDSIKPLTVYIGKLHLKRFIKER